MYFSEEMLSEIRKKINIREVTGNKFLYGKDNETYYDVETGSSGDVFHYLMTYKRMSFEEAVKRAADMADVLLVGLSIKMNRPDKFKEAVLDINSRVAGFFGFELARSKAAKAYARERGLSEKAIADYSIGFCPNVDLYTLLKNSEFSDSEIFETGLINESTLKPKMADRLIFPIRDVDGTVIGFAGRTITGDKVKYLNSPNNCVFDKSDILFGIDKLKKRHHEIIIVVEGYMDAVSLHQAGIENVVAAMGTALTKNQCSLLSQYTDAVILAQDSDEAGILAKCRSIEALNSAGLRSFVLDEKPFKDPDELIKTIGPEEFIKRINTAEDSFTFLLRNAKGNTISERMAEKAEILLKYL